MSVWENTNHNKLWRLCCTIARMLCLNWKTNTLQDAVQMMLNLSPWRFLQTGEPSLCEDAKQNCDTVFRPIVDTFRWNQAHSCTYTHVATMLSLFEQNVSIESFVGKLLFSSSSDPYIVSQFFPFYSKTTGLPPHYNWNHLMPCTIICIILYLPSPQRRVGRRWKLCRSNYLLMSAPFYGSSSLWGIRFAWGFISSYFPTWNFPHSNEVGSPLIIFISVRDVVGGDERWGLCSHSGEVQPNLVCTNETLGGQRERPNKIVLQAFRCVHWHLWVFLLPATFIFFLSLSFSSHSINTHFLHVCLPLCPSLLRLLFHIRMESRCGVGRMRL